MISIRRTLTTLGLGLLMAASLAAFGAAGAGASSTRVSITDFQWSQDPTVKLGESVTWDWIGPDLQHSVTGQEPNATQWDSFPETSMPLAPLGHSYTVTFDQPGEYVFACKLHSSVRGTVTVLNEAGDPSSDPGPQPPLNFDLEPPFIDEMYFVEDGERRTATPIARKGIDLGLRFASSERGTAEADYYRLVPKYKIKKRKVRVKTRKGVKVKVKKRKVRVRTVRRYAGYDEWPMHIGYNVVDFGLRTESFRAKNGKYVAFFHATDEASNSSDSVKLRFQIKR